VAREPFLTNPIWPGHVHLRRPYGLVVPSPPSTKEAAVLDLLMIAMTVVFFALAFLFVKGLERI
jgi:hypothetical protein